MITLTRVFRREGQTKVEKQPITVAAEAIVSVRPSNRLGKAAGHRSTILLVTGNEVDLAERFTQVKALIAAA